MLSVDVDLSFGDITGKIWDWMGNIIIRHGKDWNLGDGTSLANDTSSSLVQGREISIHITRVTTTSRNFFSGSWDLTKSIGVRTNISQNDQNMHSLFVSKIFCSGQSKTRSDNTLNSWVIGQVQEQNSLFHRTVFREISCEETSGFSVDTHSTENNSKRLAVFSMRFNQTSLSADLSSNFIMGKTSS